MIVDWRRSLCATGDDGSGKEPTQGVLVKESENIYALWCSGRSCVEGMLVELRLLKRQDLVNVLLQFLKPASDRIVSPAMSVFLLPRAARHDPAFHLPSTCQFYRAFY